MDNEKTASHASVSQGKFHTWIYIVTLLLPLSVLNVCLIFFFFLLLPVYKENFCIFVSLAAFDSEDTVHAWMHVWVSYIRSLLQWF